MRAPTDREQLFIQKFQRYDPIWPVQLTIVAAIILQVSLPDRYSAGPRIILPILEGLLLVVLSATSTRVLFVRHIFRRINALSILALIAFSNVYALQRVSQELLIGGKINNGHELIRSAINIYLTNVIVFSLVYWAIDGGGPSRRIGENPKQRDFLFIEMSTPEFVGKDWMPNFVDYLALSGNTALAFSPTDTMPLTRRAKLLMLIQSFISLVIIGLVAARAVNILA